MKLKKLIGRISLSLTKYTFIFIVGGFLYFLLEIFYRGYSHLSMYLLGGICFVLIGSINSNFYTWDMALVSQMFLSSIIVTFMELITGILLNLILKLNIWSYMDSPYNILGQVCLLYSVIWFWLSLPVILLDDFIRYKFFGEQINKYKFL